MPEINKFIVTPNYPKKFLKRQGDGMVGPLQLASLTTAQRDAIATPGVGMLIWNTTTSAVNQYNGSAWGTVGGGGSSSPLTTKGDIYGYTTTDTRIPVGADNTVLTADSTQALGLKWAVPAGGGDVSKVGTPVDSQIGVWTGDGTIEGAASLTYDGSNFQLTGDIGSTGTRITKGWFTDLQVTNAIAGSITGNAATLTNATLTTALTVNTGALTLTANADNSSVLTIGSGAVSISGANTGDQTTVSGNAGTATALETARAIYGNNFDGTAALTQVIASTYGGTGNGFTKFTGPTTTEKTFTLPDASATLLYSGGALGTPSGGTLTNCTGLPLGSITGLGANVATFLATPSSANLISAVTDETGTGALVFATSPTLVTPILGTPTSGNLSNCTAYPAATSSAQGIAELAIASEIDTGTDTTRIMPIDQFVASKRNIRWLVFNLVEAATDCATATNIAGDFVSPIAGTILQSDTTPFYLYATNSTAGTTGTMVVDISINNTSIMTTNKLDFDTTEKTTTTAATPPDLTTTSLSVGDIIRIDIDSIHTTAAKGLTVYMAIRE